MAGGTGSTKFNGKLNVRIIRAKQNNTFLNRIFTFIRNLVS